MVDFKAKILLCDDSVTMQKAVALALRKEPYALTVCDNGRDGLRLAEELMPEFVLADSDMPEMNGLELCQAIKSNPKLARVKVILLCGTYGQIDEASILETRADGRLWKPFESQVLITTLRALQAASGTVTLAEPTSEIPQSAIEPTIPVNALLVNKKSATQKKPIAKPVAKPLAKNAPELPEFDTSVLSPQVATEKDPDIVDFMVTHTFSGEESTSHSSTDVDVRGDLRAEPKGPGELPQIAPQDIEEFWTPFDEAQVQGSQQEEPHSESDIEPHGAPHIEPRLEPPSYHEDRAEVSAFAERPAPFASDIFFEQESIATQAEDDEDIVPLESGVGVSSTTSSRLDMGEGTVHPAELQRVIQDIVRQEVSSALKGWFRDALERELAKVKKDIESLGD